jgi:hypothetical protein
VLGLETRQIVFAEVLNCVYVCVPFHEDGKTSKITQLWGTAVHMHICVFDRLTQPAVTHFDFALLLKATVLPALDFCPPFFFLIVFAYPCLIILLHQARLW